MKNFFILLTLILYLIVLVNYEGNILILSFFYISSNFYLLYSFRKKSIFTEIFLAFFLWMGFWFKFVLVITKIGDLTEGSGLFDFYPTSYDKPLLILSYAFVLLIVMSFLRERFLFSYETFCNKKFSLKEKSIDFYFKHKTYFLVIFIFLISFCAIINLKYSVYQKGIISNTQLNPIFLSIFKWLTMFGFASISSFIIFCFIKRKKNMYIAFFLALYESYITSYGFLSRASLIFSQLSFILGLKKYAQLSDSSFLNKKILLYLFLIIFISLTSIHFVNLKRDQQYSKNYTQFLDIDKIFMTIKTIDLNDTHSLRTVKNAVTQNETIYLIFNRWVGLDSWLAVLSHQNLSSDLFFDSFKEKFNKKEFSYYQNNFLKKKNIEYIPEFENNYGIIVPGFISFSFYSGSIFFFLILITFFYILGVTIEYLSFRLSFGNLIFSSLMAQVYIYRLVHFGYQPSQSYLLIGALLLNIFLYYLFVLLINKLK